MTDAGFYSRIAYTARRLLDRYGQEAQLLRATTGAYDPATGLAGQTFADPEPIQAAMFEYEEKAIDGSLILRGDQRVIAAVSAAAPPALTDVLLWNGTERWTIVSPERLAPAGINVIYELQVRR